MHSNEEQLQALGSRATNDSVKMKTCADSLPLGHRNTRSKVENNCKVPESNHRINYCFASRTTVLITVKTNQMFCLFP